MTHRPHSAELLLNPLPLFLHDLNTPLVAAYVGGESCGRRFRWSTLTESGSSVGRLFVRGNQSRRWFEAVTSR